MGETVRKAGAAAGILLLLFVVVSECSFTLPERDIHCVQAPDGEHYYGCPAYIGTTDDDWEVPHPYNYRLWDYAEGQ